MSETVDVDVAVVGAGLSGLYAASRVEQGGLSALVLEARDRVGGRVHSVPFAGATVDVGAQWIGQTQDSMYALARALEVPIFPQYTVGQRLLDLGGPDAPRAFGSIVPPLTLAGSVDAAQLLARIELCRRLVSLQRPEAGALAARWDAMSLRDWLRRSARTAEMRALIALGAQMLLAVEPEDLSLLYFLFYLQSAGGFYRIAEVERGAQQDRIEGGAQRLAQGLAQGLKREVRLSSPVRRIVQNATSVRVEADTVTVRAARVILAVPPALAARIEFDPALPAARRDYQENMPMGSVVKCIIAYERAFWRERGLRGEALSTEFPCRAYFDDCGPSGAHPALVGFVVGADARRFATLSRASRAQAVTTQLVRLFGGDAIKVSAYMDHNWMAETWSGGCYAGVPGPGVVTRVRAGATRMAACARIHFAGTESALYWTGYMEGALIAGARAADEVCDAIVS